MMEHLRSPPDHFEQVKCFHNSWIKTNRGMISESATYLFVSVVVSMLYMPLEIRLSSLAKKRNDKIEKYIIILP